MFYIIPRIGGLAYFNIPKSACTSILRALSKMRATEDNAPTTILADGSDPIHGFYPSHAHYDYFFGRWPLDYPPLPASLIKFTFVRNPYTRFYSFYNSKIKLGQTPGDFYKKFGLKKSSSFASCVRTITSIDPNELEHHILPQSMMLCRKGELLADFIGKVENSSTDWAVIQRLTGFEMELGRDNTTQGSARPIYTRELQECIYEYYRNDFELFGYDKGDIKIKHIQKERTDNKCCTAHIISDRQVQELRTKLAVSIEKVRNISWEFERHPVRRQQYYAFQSEQFRELLQKRLLNIQNDLSVIKNKTKNSLLRQANALSNFTERTTRAIEKDRIRIVKIESTLAKESNRVAKIEETQTKEKNRVAKIEEIQTKEKNRVAKIEEIQDSESTRINQTLGSIVELRKIENLLAQERKNSARLNREFSSYIMLMYNRNRRDYWKRMLRYLRSMTKKEFKILSNSGYVDPFYYFSEYPDVISSGLSATQHYILYGAQEGRNPAKNFNTIEYIIANPQIAHIGINPLVYHVLNDK